MRLRKVKLRIIQFLGDFVYLENFSGVIVLIISGSTVLNSRMIVFLTALEDFLSDLSASKNLLHLSTKVTTHSEPVFPITVSASQWHITSLVSTSEGRSYKVWLITIFPRISIWLLLWRVFHLWRNLWALPRCPWGNGPRCHRLLCIWYYSLTDIWISHI